MKQKELPYPRLYFYGASELEEGTETTPGVWRLEVYSNIWGEFIVDVADPYESSWGWTSMDQYVEPEFIAKLEELNQALADWLEVEDNKLHKYATEDFVKYFDDCLSLLFGWDSGEWLCRNVCDWATDCCYDPEIHDSYDYEGCDCVQHLAHEHGPSKFDFVKNPPPKVKVDNPDYAVK